MKGLYVLAVGLALCAAEIHRSDHADLVDFYSFSARDIKGNIVDLEQYRGKVSERLGTEHEVV